MTDSKAAPKIAELDDLGREIQSVLREDRDAGGKLMYGEPEEGSDEFECYCAVAAEAYFYLSGAAVAGLDSAASDIDWQRAGKAALAAGLQPMQLTRLERHGTWPRRHTKKRSHRWIRRRSAPGIDEVIDLTIGPGDPKDTGYPYAEGHPRGFQQHGYKRPSKSRGVPLIGMILRRRLNASE